MAKPNTLVVFAKNGQTHGFAVAGQQAGTFAAHVEPGHAGITALETDTRAFRLAAYTEIRLGRLKLLKIGRRSLISCDGDRRSLESLPAKTKAAALGQPS